jgi:hypothetical protein
MFFLATSHTKNTIIEKTNKHTIQLICPKKRYEHTLFFKVIIIAFTHIIGTFKQGSNGKIMYKDKYMISLTKRTCSCGSFMKHAVCGHILAYTYRHTKLDKECWFGEQYSNLPTDFARNAKRGAPKKQTGLSNISIIRF